MQRGVSLLQAGIIVPVDTSEWLSPLVVARKHKGDLRLCVDLGEPNKSAIIDALKKNTMNVCMLFSGL